VRDQIARLDLQLTSSKGAALHGRVGRRPETEGCA
jgi:hypothetical protein